MDNKTFVRRLKKLGACQPAIDWVKEHGGTAQECWEDCKNDHWLSWLANNEKRITPTNTEIDKLNAELALLDNKHDRKIDSVWKWYKREYADTIRKHIPTIYEDK